MSSQPNVLLICTDHWACPVAGRGRTPGDSDSHAGHPGAQAGVRFTNAYSECPVCIPARRTLMTGMSTRAHGDREFKVLEPMPAFPTLAQTFRDNGYQAQAVGKLHVYPQRDRIGFDDVMLVEEGRPILGAVDDYDLWLGDQGQAGQGYAHGMSNNEYTFRPWHLPETHHTTNWITRTMCRQIKRRESDQAGLLVSVLRASPSAAGAPPGISGSVPGPRHGRCVHGGLERRSGQPALPPEGDPIQVAAHASGRDCPNPAGRLCPVHAH